MQIYLIIIGSEFRPVNQQRAKGFEAINSPGHYQFPIPFINHQNSSSLIPPFPLEEVLELLQAFPELFELPEASALLELVEPPESAVFSEPFVLLESVGVVFASSVPPIFTKACFEESATSGSDRCSLVSFSFVLVINYLIELCPLFRSLKHFISWTISFVVWIDRIVRHFRCTEVPFAG